MFFPISRPLGNKPAKNRSQAFVSLGRPWVKSINTAPLYALVKERYAKEDPGVMNAEYGLTREDIRYPRSLT